MADISSIATRIAHAETRGEKNPYGAKGRAKFSTDSGRYQFTWSKHNKEINRITGVKTREEFLNSPEAQDKYMRYWENNTLKPAIKKVRTAIPTTTYTDDEIMALAHHHGVTGAIRNIKTGKENKEYIRQINNAVISPAQRPVVVVNKPAEIVGPTPMTTNIRTSEGDPYEYTNTQEGWKYRKRGTQEWVNPTVRGAEAIGKRYAVPEAKVGMRIKKKYVYNMQSGGDAPVEIQAERGEMMSSPDGNINEVAARKMHSQMYDDQVTDMPREGDYIGSDFAKMKIDKKWGGLFILGQTVPDYTEGQKPKEPEVITLADFMPKKKSTPAEIMKYTQKKFPLTDRKEDYFAAVARLKNKQSRLPVLAAIKQIADMQKQMIGDTPGQDQMMANEQENTMPMEQLKTGGLIKKYQLGGLPQYAYDSLNEYIKGRKNFKPTAPLPTLPPGLVGPNKPGVGTKPGSSAIGGFGTTSLPEMDIADLEAYYKQLLGETDKDMNAPDPAWVSQVPYATGFAKGIIGNLGLAAQNPNSSYYNVSPSVKSRMFQKVDTSLLQDKASSDFASKVLGPTLSYADQSGANVMQKASLVGSRYGALQNQLNDIGVKGYMDNLDTTRKEAGFENDVNYKNYMVGNKNVENRNQLYSQIAQFNMTIPEEYKANRAYEGLYNEQRKGTLKGNKAQLLRELAQLRYLKQIA